MEGLRVFVGIDVSKEALDVFVRPNGEKWRSANDAEGISSLVERLKRVSAKHIVLEASGGYEQACVAELLLAKLPASVVNPRPVRDFANALGKLAKTDEIDAEVIAHFAEVLQPSTDELDDDATQRLRDAVARRQQLIEMRTMELNRLEHAQKDLKKSIEDHLRYLNKQIKDSDKDISKRIRESKAWCDKARVLESQPGIARTTSAKLIVDLPELGKLSPKKITALVGVAPYNDDSGARQDGKKFCRGGRSDVRCALYMPTITAIQHDPKIAAFYERLVRQGKEKKSAIIACMRKLLVRLNAMLREMKPWNPEMP
jgi:transposase